MTKYAYWNQNTGQIARFDAPNSRLEHEPNWHPIDPAVRDEDAPVPPLDSVTQAAVLPHIPPPPGAVEDTADGPLTPVTGPVDDGDTEGDGAEGTDTEPAEDSETKAPGRSASKADWLAYAISRGAEAADAEKLTRDQLAETYGGTTDAQD